MNIQQLQRNTQILCKYIPEKAAPLIARWTIELDFKLKITRERNTRLGDYRPPANGKNHQITVNYNLNPYAFLVTLVHEIAHLTCFNKFRDSVNPHGSEWKNEFKQLMGHFLNREIFPDDVLYGLMAHMRNPSASSCSDPALQRILKRYDTPDKNGNYVFLEKLPYRTKFLYNGDRVFEKGERIRTRFRCVEIATGSVYLFNPLAEVELFEPLNSVESSFKIEF